MNTDLIDLESLVQETEELEALPASAVRLAGIVATDDWTLQEVAEIIRLDQALTARLLGVANSALSGARATITSTDQAVVRLGPGAVLSIAIGSSVRGQMQAALPEYGLAEGDLWRHSVGVALAVEHQRSYSKLKVAPHAFAAGLLHDIGKLVFARQLEPTVLTYIERACAEDGLSAEEAEQEVLRACHAELGALVISNWGLPECIATAVRFHHNPLHANDETSRRVCFQIALADAVASQIGVGCGDQLHTPDFTPAMAGRLGVTQDGFGALCADVEARLEDVLAAYA